MTDLTKEEQAAVRGALQFLRRRFGGWGALGKALKLKDSTLAHVGTGKAVSALIAFRVARFVHVSVDDLLSGKYPAPGTCPYCGHCSTSKESTDGS